LCKLGRYQRLRRCNLQGPQSHDTTQSVMLVQQAAMTTIARLSDGVLTADDNDAGGILLPKVMKQSRKTIDQRLSERNTG
jgi:hypothetical protein